MDERRRLLALLEVYDTAIEELYVLGDRGLVDLILRLERRSGDAARRLSALEDQEETGVSGWVAEEISLAQAPRPYGSRLTRSEGSPLDVSDAGATLRAAG
jgi:hypothetical protein